MTRNEQFKDARHDVYLKFQNPDICYGFDLGAEWSNETMIDRACEWLECHYLPPFMDEDGDENSIREFVEQFRKAMQDD